MTKETIPDTYDDLYEFALERMLRKQIYSQGYKDGWLSALKHFNEQYKEAPSPEHVPDKILFGSLEDFDNE